VRKAYQHHDELSPDRLLTVETDTEHVRIACDSPGVASVSHVLSWDEWAALVASVMDPNAIVPPEAA